MAEIEVLEGITAADEEVHELMKAGVHVGHIKSKTHPRMRPFIFTTRNNVQIIDVLKTKEYLRKAEAYLRSVVARGGIILWVGTKPSARTPVEAAAKSVNMPWVTARWIGGLLTNYKVMRKRVETMEDIERRKESGDLEKYTKHERARIMDEHQSLLKNLNGLRRLTRVPDAMIVIDAVHDHLAVAEARRMKVPVIALADSNTNPELIQYFVPSNDDARLAVEYMTKRFQEAVEEGLLDLKRAELEAKEKERAAAEETTEKK